MAAATLARVRRIPGAAALARAVAILGEDVDLNAAAALAGLQLRAASAVADSLADAMILDRGRPLRFAHPIVRSAVYEAIPTAIRSEMHATAARLRAAEGAPPDAVATHLLQTEPRGEAVTAEALRDAASASVARGAPETAVEALERALAEPPPEDARPEVLRELGSSLMRVGRPDAADVLEDAFYLAVTQGARALTALDLTNALMQAGRSPAAVTVIETILDDPTGVEPVTLAWFEALLYSNAFVTVSGRRLVERRLRAVAADYNWSDDARSRLLAGPVAWEWVVGPGGRAEWGGELAEPALRDGWLVEKETADGTLALGTANALWVSGRYEAANEALSALVADAQRRGSVRGFAIATANRAYGRYLGGRLSDAEADVEAYSHPLAESGWSMFDATVAAVRAAIRLERADLQGAKQVLASYTDVRDDEVGTTQFLNLSRAATALAAGDGRGALADLELCRRFEQSYNGGPGLACLVAWRSPAALAHLSLGQVDRARQLAAEEVGLAREYGAPRPLGVALRALGVSEGGDRGVERLEEAVYVLESADSIIEQARALTDLGTALRQAGKTNAARERLRAGMNLAHSCGAKAIAQRAREELVAAGARPRRLATSGPNALTASERRVAGMAVDGMSNREIAQALFVTVRTVEGHLTNAFAKLAIASREELTGALSSGRAPRPTSSPRSSRG